MTAGVVVLSPAVKMPPVLSFCAKMRSFWNPISTPFKSLPMRMIEKPARLRLPEWLSCETRKPRPSEKPTLRSRVGNAGLTTAPEEKLLEYPPRALFPEKNGTGGTDSATAVPSPGVTVCVNPTSTPESQPGVVGL